jgi:anti-sigma B factor antagonist
MHAWRRLPLERKRLTEEVSMDIIKHQDGTTLTIGLVGRLDTNTSPQLQEELDSSLDGIVDLVVDFAQIDYISSAGLRVLLAAQKRMASQGSLTIVNACDAVMEVFDMTGFSDILTIK